MPHRLSMVPRLALALGMALVATAPSWSSPVWASAPPAHKVTHTKAHKLGPLSGKWSGTYSGAFSGTFKLTWQEVGPKLSGTITISGFSNAATSIHGTVKDNSISFGTVGSQAITYSGSVSGKSMSGTWKIVAGGRAMGSGSWSASKA